MEAALGRRTPRRRRGHQRPHPMPGVAQPSRPPPCPARPEEISIPYPARPPLRVGVPVRLVPGSAQVADEWCLAASYEWRITTGPAGGAGPGTSLAVAAVLSELAAVPCRWQLARLRVRTSPVRT